MQDIGEILNLVYLKYIFAIFRLKIIKHELFTEQYLNW